MEASRLEPLSIDLGKGRFINGYNDNIFSREASLEFMEQIITLQFNKLGDGQKTDNKSEESGHDPGEYMSPQWPYRRRFGVPFKSRSLELILLKADIPG